MKVASKQLIYLYCVTNRVSGLAEIKNLVKEIYFIHHAGIYAVISKVSGDEFSEENLKRNFKDIEWVKTRASLHEQIIEGVMKNSSVVPFKFATLFNSEDSLKTCIENHEQELKEHLRNVEGREEWGVKIYCDMDKLKQGLIREDGEIFALQSEISSSTPGKAFLLERKKQERLNIEATGKVNEYCQDSFARLGELSVRTRLNKLLPREVTERKDDMVLNSAFLVEKDKVSAFTRLVATLGTEYSGRGLYFDCTGPWPPYNFCDLSRQEAEDG